MLFLYDGFHQRRKIESEQIITIQCPCEFEQVVRRAVTNVIDVQQRTELLYVLAEALGRFPRV